MAVGGALFSGGGRAAPASKALVEFRAGKMNMSGTTVTPDKRKGQVMVEQGEDELMHFKWKDRTSGTIEDDLIIFPDDIEFKRVAQCTTGRVFILKFKSSSRKLFFWMQEPKEDKDEEFCKKVNDYLNNPPAAGSTGSSRSAAGSALAAAAAGIPGLDMANLRDSELQSLLNHMSQQQLMQLFGEAGNLLGGQTPTGTGSSTRQRSSVRAAAAAAAATPTATPAATPAVAAPTVTAAATTTTTPVVAATPAPAAAASASPSAKGSILLSDLQSILSGIKVPPGAGGAAGSSGPEVDLAHGLTTDLLQPLLENQDFVRKMKELLPTVPGEESVEDPATEIKGTVQSPQFKQALSMFSTGLQTGQLAPLIREFELGEEAVVAAGAGDMEAFVKALQKNVGEKKPKEDEGMDLD